MLGTGVEPAPAINGKDFKSSVSTIPPSELNTRKNLATPCIENVARFYCLCTIRSKKN